MPDFIHRFLGVLAMTLLAVAGVAMMAVTTLVVLGSGWSLTAKAAVVLAGCAAVAATIVAGEFIMHVTAEA